MALGLCDPVSCFIKDEPHPSRKAVDGHWRIVNALSLVDQLVERFLFSDLLHCVHAGYPNLPTMSGVGFTDEQSAELCEHYLSLVDRAPPNFVPFSEDVSGWDRTFSEQRMQSAVGKTVGRATGPSHWRKAATLWGKRLTRPVFVLPEVKGCSYWVSQIAGRMLSGSLLTTCLNGVARVDSIVETGGRDAFANGDDGVSMRLATTADSVSCSYKALGIAVRELTQHDRSGFNFCSHFFDCDKRVSYLTSWPKALYRLLTRTSSDLLLEDFLREVRNHPDLEEIRQVAAVFRHLPTPPPGDGGGKRDDAKHQQPTGHGPPQGHALSPGQEQEAEATPGATQAQGLPVF